MEARNRERLNLSVSKRTKERLDQLVELTDAASSAEVVKQAILTYEALAKRLMDGDKFYVEKRSGKLVPFDLLIDVPAARDAESGTAREAA